jgi:hypothetical protein
MIAVGLGILLLISIIAFIICVLVLNGNISGVVRYSSEWSGIVAAACLLFCLIVVALAGLGIVNNPG